MTISAYWKKENNCVHNYLLKIFIFRKYNECKNEKPLTSLEFFDYNGIARHFISIFGSWFLHTSGEPYFVRLIALDRNASDFHPHQNLCLHSFDSTKLSPRQCSFDANAVSYNRRVLEAHFTGRRQVNNELALWFIKFVTCYVPGKQAGWKVVLSEKIRQRFLLLTCTRR